ncbi:MAG: hypothetical protein CR979_00980 [Propionibacterium sp.]|nr:MAG: hypothetical protein CR979_00980 [Propionibacterium sp.]
MTRISKNQLLTIAKQLSDTQASILGLLGSHRFATTDQLARYHQPLYKSKNSAIRQTNRTTKHLANLGLIRHLNRRIGGSRSGSSGYIWHLTEAGQRLAGIDPKDPLPHLRPTNRWREPSLTFLTHTLAVTEVRIIFEETSHNQPLKIVSVETEPACWRQHISDYGQTETLKPDIAIITKQANYEDHWWCEIDLGSENPARITQKALTYLNHYNYGIEQQTRGIFPKVLWITPTKTRCNQLQKILTTSPKLPAGMHTASTLEQLPNLICQKQS